VRAKIRLKIKISEKTKKSEKTWDIGKLNTNEVKEEFIKEVTANVHNPPYISHMGQHQKGTNEAAGKIIEKEDHEEIAGFDEECQIILEDKNRAYNKMINRNTKQSEKEYKDKRKDVQ